MKMKRMFIFFFSGAFLVLFVFQSCEKKEENPPDTGVTITETGGSTDVTEGGNTDTYNVNLAFAPAQDVMIGITTDNQVTVDKNLLTFTSANWNISQTVTVTAVDDNIPEGDHTGTINHNAASGDANWAGLNIPSVTAHITDNDLSLILAGSRTGHYVIVDPVTGTDMVENDPNIHAVGRHCLGYLCKNVVVISPPGAGTFVNVLYTMDRQTAANPIKITQEANYDVLWVDGSEAEPRLVFCAKELVNNKNHIYAVNEDGTNLVQLTFDEELVTIMNTRVSAKLVGASMPSFSPDGMSVAFNLYSREVNTNYAHNSICIMSSGGGNKTVIFDVQKEETHYRDICWSMDGQFVIFSYENNGRRVLAVHTSSMTQSDFTSQMEVGGTKVENLWSSPLEKKIVYNIHVPGGGSLYQVNYTTLGSNVSISGSYTQLTDAVAVGHGYAEPDWQKWDGK